MAIMKEVTEKKATITFVLRLMPLPIGLQNCILAVCLLFFFIYDLIFILFLGFICSYLDVSNFKWSWIIS